MWVTIHHNNSNQLLSDHKRENIFIFLFYRPRKSSRKRFYFCQNEMWVCRQWSELRVKIRKRLPGQAGAWEKWQQTNSVPPSFTAPPRPPTRGHKPARNTQAQPKLPRTRGRKRERQSIASLWTDTSHAEVSYFSPLVCSFESPQKILYELLLLVRLEVKLK